MDTYSSNDGATVVAGPSSNAGKTRQRSTSDLFNTVEKTHATGHQPVEKVVGNQFAREADYSFQNRPFFIPIEKSGLIGALQKLDRELQNVSVPSALWITVDNWPQSTSLVDRAFYQGSSQWLGQDTKSPLVNLVSSTMVDYQRSWLDLVDTQDSLYVTGGRGLMKDPKGKSLPLQHTIYHAN